MYINTAISAANIAARNAVLLATRTTTGTATKKSNTDYHFLIFCIIILLLLMFMYLFNKICTRKDSNKTTHD